MVEKQDNLNNTYEIADSAIHQMISLQKTVVVKFDSEEDALPFYLAVCSFRDRCQGLLSAPSLFDIVFQSSLEDLGESIPFQVQAAQNDCGKQVPVAIRTSAPTLLIEVNRSPKRFVLLPNIGLCDLRAVNKSSLQELARTAAESNCSGEKSMIILPTDLGAALRSQLDRPHQPLIHADSDSVICRVASKPRKSEVEEARPHPQEREEQKDGSETSPEKRQEELPIGHPASIPSAVEEDNFPVPEDISTTAVAKPTQELKAVHQIHSEPSVRDNPRRAGVLNSLSRSDSAPVSRSRMPQELLDGDERTMADLKNHHVTRQHMENNRGTFRLKVLSHKHAGKTATFQKFNGSTTCFLDENNNPILLSPNHRVKILYEDS